MTEAVSIADYTVAVGPTTLNANHVIAANDPQNLPPAPGMQFVMVPFSVTNNAAGIRVPWFDLDFAFAAADGSWYGEHEEDQCGEIPGAMMYLGELAPGAAGVGNVCASVPADKIDGGLWFVKRDGAYTGWTGYFALGTEVPYLSGSPADPTPADQVVAVGSYAVALGATMLNADDIVEENDATNAPPSDGLQYVLAPVTVTNNGGSDTNVPWFDLDFWFVAADETIYGAAGGEGCGEIPDALMYEGELAVNTTATANVCVSVPSDQVDTGAWLVKPVEDAIGWTGFFALA